MQTQTHCDDSIVANAQWSKNINLFQNYRWDALCSLSLIVMNRQQRSTYLIIEPVTLIHHKLSDNALTGRNRLNDGLCQFIRRSAPRHMELSTEIDIRLASLFIWKWSSGSAAVILCVSPVLSFGSSRNWFSIIDGVRSSNEMASVDWTILQMTNRPMDRLSQYDGTKSEETAQRYRCFN